MKIYDCTFNQHVLQCFFLKYVRETEEEKKTKNKKTKNKKQQQIKNKK